MNISDLTILLGKNRQEIEEMLKSNDVIELNLKERNQKEVNDSGKIELIA
ncbi:hypothetical protein ISS05_01575 [Candidatus Woesearchaeota archaeon]|nr:hypothetical protein [Candidatus Woesearchaeota archaeon]